MMKKNNQSDSSRKIKTYKFILIVVYSAIAAACLFSVSAFTVGKTDQVLKSKVLQMSAELGLQMEINLDNYMNKIESLCTLAFTEETVYKYDDTAYHPDEYDVIKAKATISDYLFNISMMENFVDFGIVYSNDEYTGRISNGTLSAFSGNLYSTFRNSLNNSEYSQGWAAGLGGDYSRIYYIKEVHENAVLVVSLYSSEFDNIFEHSDTDEMKNLSIQIIDNNDIILYSANSTEISTKPDHDILSRIEHTQYLNRSTIDNNYLVSVFSCQTGWRLVSTLETDVLVRETKEVRDFVLVLSATILLLTVLVTVLVMERVMTPVNTMVSNLDDEAHTDLLTGVLNKRSFENFTENTIKNSDKKSCHALILIDLDNFKGVNDTLGHVYGDRVLAGVGDILRSVFTDSDLLGRIGGDEFCVFLDIPFRYSHKEYAEKKCTELCRAFADNYTGDDNSYKISASIGAAFFPDSGSSFDELYRLADRALYCSKHRGKDTYTIYSKDMEATEDEQT